MVLDVAEEGMGRSKKVDHLPICELDNFKINYLCRSTNLVPISDHSHPCRLKFLIFYLFWAVTLGKKGMTLFFGVSETDLKINFQNQEKGNQTELPISPFLGIKVFAVANVPKNNYVTGGESNFLTCEKVKYHVLFAFSRI